MTPVKYKLEEHRRSMQATAWNNAMLTVTPRSATICRGVSNIGEIFREARQTSTACTHAPEKV
eukprot:CAMPEP_0183418080 /NCGR_PEP_ID=MMETSP0370-20130417/24866_1 /TAXON_ID=268820 /ORGANISM="Peridinium aciculiferum, Strain PAER-2" /LENGTH=62 /DNA_ID=CAMNT_0025601737 /DNA_START=44 /DNA_END=233 /DNA_ORIENTATION=+